MSSKYATIDVVQTKTGRYGQNRTYSIPCHGRSLIDMPKQFDEILDLVPSSYVGEGDLISLVNNRWWLPVVSGRFKPINHTKVYTQVFPADAHHGSTNRYHNLHDVTWNPGITLIDQSCLSEYLYRFTKRIPGPSDEMINDLLFESQKSHKILGTHDSDLATALFELREVKTLASWFSKKWLRESSISDKYLSGTFGALPLYSDVKKLLNFISNFQNAVDRWNKAVDNGTTYNAHASREFYQESGEEVDHSEYYLNSSIIVDTEKRYKFSSVATVKTSVYYRPSQRINDSDLLLVASKLLGFDNPSKIVWNLIPFSFLVDWFINISSVIDRWTLGQPVAKYEVDSIGHSVKKECNVELFLKHSWRGQSWNGTGIRTSYVNYYRTPLHRSAANVPQIRGKLEWNPSFSAGKAFSLAALTDQFLRPKRS